MEKKARTRFIVLWLLIAALLLAGSLLSPSAERENVQTAMKDAVLHEENRILLFPGFDVAPGLVSSIVITCLLLLGALLIRLFAIPRFREIPGKGQLLLETAVSCFDGLAASASPYRNRFLGAYAFSAGSYVFLSTLFELFGFQAVTAAGRSVALPAPLSDINGAISLGVMSYLVIVSGGAAGAGLKGVGRALKDFSLPLSMSFRLFGALLSGLLVTELVYHYTALSFVLPVIVAVMFTLMHALIQAYVLTMLTTMFYGEAAEPLPKKIKKA